MRRDHLAEDRRRLLEALLPNVPFDGWSWTALERAAEAAGLGAGAARRLFPDGPAEAICFFAAEGDRRMEEALGRLDLPGMKVRARIAAAVRLRLEQQAPHREAVRRALARQALPGHAAGALGGLWRTADAIWYAVGDTATDFNYYSKRFLLSGVYASTLLFWLNDNSEDFADTWAFLDRRIADVMRIQQARGPLDRLGGRLPSPWGLLGRLRHGPRRAA